VFYIGVPDMAIGPLYYSVYDAACVTGAAEFPDAGKTRRGTRARSRTACRFGASATPSRSAPPS